MSEIHPRLRKLLDERGVAYEIIHHRDDFRARTTAEDTHTPPGEFAKSVFLWIDGSYAIAAVPATDYVSERGLARSLGAEEVRLASESEMEALCPDCEVGAAPPFGDLFGIPTYASRELAEERHITFNAGTHRDALRMTWSDYARAAEPEVLDFARHPEEREHRGPR